MMFSYFKRLIPKKRLKNVSFQYTISDYMGRVVMQGESDKTIETETLASGSYILSIKNEEMFTVKKMVKYNP